MEHSEQHLDVSSANDDCQSRVERTYSVQRHEHSRVRTGHQRQGVPPRNQAAADASAIALYSLIERYRSDRASLTTHADIEVRVGFRDRLSGSRSCVAARRVSGASSTGGSRAVRGCVAVRRRIWRSKSICCCPVSDGRRTDSVTRSLPVGSLYKLIMRWALGGIHLIRGSPEGHLCTYIHTARQ